MDHPNRNLPCPQVAVALSRSTWRPVESRTAAVRRMGDRLRRAVPHRSPRSGTALRVTRSTRPKHPRPPATSRLASSPAMSFMAALPNVARCPPDSVDLTPSRALRAGRRYPATSMTSPTTPSHSIVGQESPAALVHLAPGRHRPRHPSAGSAGVVDASAFSARRHDRPHADGFPRAGRTGMRRHGRSARTAEAPRRPSR